MNYLNKEITAVDKNDLEYNPLIEANYEGWKDDYLANFQTLKIDKFNDFLKLGVSSDLLHIALNLGFHNNFIKHFNLDYMFDKFARLHNKKTFQERFCENCTDSSSNNGHDKCLMNLPGVVNACCGHGDKEQAYVMFSDGRVLRGFTVEQPEQQCITKLSHKENNTNVIKDGVDLFDMLIVKNNHL